MGKKEYGLDVFAIPNFEKPSAWLESSYLDIQHDPFFALDVTKTSIHDLNDANIRPNDHGYFQTPPLLDLPATLPEVRSESTSLSRGPISQDVLETEETEAEDIWLLDGQRPTRRPEHKTWAKFGLDEADELPVDFITESRSSAFEALLAAQDSPFGITLHENTNIVAPGVYCGCLLSLALGRSSLLFSWNEESGSFSENLQHVKTSGFSHESLAGIVEACRECGNTTRYLQSHVDKTYASHPGPSKIALAHAVDKLLSTVQAELGVRGQKSRSLLQLMALVRPVQSALTYFGRLVGKTAPVKTDEQILSLLFQEVEATEHRDGFLHNAICEVLRMVTRPWIGFVEEWIGLKPEDGGLAVTKSGPGRSFVKVESRMWVDDQGFELEEPDYFLDDENVPSFMPGDMAQDIFETGRNLRFLRLHHPDHLLVRQDEIMASDAPRLQWQFGWDAITRVEVKAKSYEAALLQSIRGRPDETVRRDENNQHSTPQGGDELQFFGKDEAQVMDAMLASMEVLDRNIILDAPTRDDDLAKILQDQLFDQGPFSDRKAWSFTPHWSLLPLLSFGPAVAAQARLVNGECMRLLFVAHGLRDHLHLLRQYHLLGNGLFCSRLSHALFDPDLDTAERKSGVALSGSNMGLRLSGRESWPPASSELRLALMGVLADSFEPGPGTCRVSSKDSLLATTSFAVRDLSPEEIDRCVDPDSLEALDFLRLSYKPPPALLPIMTPVVLVKHDKIFRFLLRVLRVLFVVNQLFCDVVSPSSCRPSPNPPTTAAKSADSDACLRFRIEAHHFVTRLAAYAFDSGIGAPWRRFEDWLDWVQKRLARVEKDPAAAGDARAYSPDRLRDCHEQVLDEIMRALLLRKRQRPALKLLEDILAAVLQFAKRLRQLQSTPSVGGSESEDFGMLYRSFRKKVDVFVTVCRALSEKDGGRYGADKGSTGLGIRMGGEGGQESASCDVTEHSISRLLLLLDMSGYYTATTTAATATATR